MKIKILPTDVVNKIAAGEVLEKPANAVKELLENAIDAGSLNIKVELEQAGRNLIRVTDNGIGISKEDLPLAIEKHATSKLNTNNLYDINYLGFRGEALHSIAITSEMKITSSFNGKGNTIDATTKEIRPHHIHCGTIIEIRNLFYNIPNKLRFLRSEKTELSCIIELINKLALVNPQISFELLSNGRQIIDYKATTLLKRMEEIKVLGSNFVKNLIHVKHSDGNLSGAFFFGLPTLTQKKNNCFTFINNRPVKDGIIASVIKHTYNDYIPKNTYPIAVIFIKVPNDDVDVNIHPNKSEVKFQDPQAIRRFTISAISGGLLQHGNNTSTTLADHALEKFEQVITEQKNIQNASSDILPQYDVVEKKKIYQGRIRTHLGASEENPFNEKLMPFSVDQKSINNHTLNQNRLSKDTINDSHLENKKYLNSLNESKNTTFWHQTSQEIEYVESSSPKKYFANFGVFKCQIHGTFIVTESETEMIIIDQHAAHERVLYEQMKINMFSPGQILLISEFVPLSEEAVEILDLHAKKLKEIGLTVERTSHCSVMVNSLPQELKNIPTNELIEEVVSLLKEEIEPKTLLERIYANIACKKAIKANHKLTKEEVEELLTLMEKFPHTAQCNHGRPTYVRLPFKDIEKLFLRS